MIKIEDLKDPINKDKLLEFQDNIFNEFNKMLKNLANNNYKKSALITYWLNDYKNYLENEDSFTPTKLVKYKRGSIIKVNLGFNIGNEQGGLHYCVVLNKDDSIHKPILNVIPLTSIKDPDKKVHYTNVNLGNEVYDLLKTKVEENKKLSNMYLSKTNLMNKKLEEILNFLESIKCEDRNIEKSILNSSKPILDMLFEDFINIINDTDLKDNYLNSVMETIKNIEINTDDFYKIYQTIRLYSNLINNLIDIVNKRMKTSVKILEEISKMKKGSIAHVDQIATISKMRIYNPKSTEDALYNVRLSNESLTLIDNKIKELFTY